MTDRRVAFDEEGLPWLEAVPDEEGPRGVSGRKMAAALLIVVIAVLMVAGTSFLLGRRDSAPTDGAPELIKADPRPYKVKPSDPGGLDVAGESETAFATSAGADTDAQIDLGAVAETPIARPEKLPPPVPRVERTAEVLKPVVQEPKPVPEAAPAPSGTVIQLGAFSSAAKAEAAWQALTARFGALGGLSKIVVPVSSSKLFRLRAGAASPADAKAMCQSLKVAGESCVVVG